MQAYVVRCSMLIVLNKPVHKFRDGTVLSRRVGVGGVYWTLCFFVWVLVSADFVCLGVPWR